MVAVSSNTWLSTLDRVTVLTLRHVLSSLSKVSLVEALEKERLPPKSKTEPLLPLVRESRAEAGHGILTSRQKRWMQSRPNESSVENPVNFK